MEAFNTTDVLVSVIIPTHNRAELLRRALWSVLGQTHSHLEVIVIDDGSSDDTAAVVDRLQDGRIRYLKHSRPLGAPAARNAGIRVASGAVIGFLDDDDEWELDKVAEQLKLLAHYQAVICASNLSSDLHRLQHKQTVTLEDLRRGKFTMGGTGVLMARAVVVKVLTFDETLPRYQDWDLFIRVAQQHVIGYLNKPLVRYNAGQHNRITNSLLGYRAADLEKQFVMLRKHRKFFGARWFRRHMSRAMLYGLIHRTDKWSLLGYTIRRYGPMGTLNAVCIRAIAIIRARWRRLMPALRLSERRSTV